MGICTHRSYHNHFLPPEFLGISVLARVIPSALVNAVLQALNIRDLHVSISNGHDKVLWAQDNFLLVSNRVRADNGSDPSLRLDVVCWLRLKCRARPDVEILTFDVSFKVVCDFRAREELGSCSPVSS